MNLQSLLWPNHASVTFFGLEIYWYAIIIVFGMTAAFFVISLLFRRRNMSTELFLTFFVICLPIAIITTRLFYCVTSGMPIKDWFSIQSIRQGGLAITGGILGGAASVLGVCYFKKVNFFRAGDCIVVGLLLAQSIGRWGNFVNQEAFGTNTTLPWGMYSEKTADYLSSIAADMYFDQGIMINPKEPVHPCFLYESVWCILGFLVILAYKNFRKFDGELMLFYAAWYGTGRAFIEGIRTDSLMIGPFRVSQLVAIGICIAGVALLVLGTIKAKKEAN